MDSFRIISALTNLLRRLQSPPRSNLLIKIRANNLGFTLLHMAMTQPLPPWTWKTMHHAALSLLMATCKAMWSQQLRKLVNSMANQAAGCRTQPTRKNWTQHVVCNLTNQRLHTKLAVRKDTAPTPVISLPCQYSFNDTSKPASGQRRQSRMWNVVGLINRRIKAAHPALHP